MNRPSSTAVSARKSSVTISNVTLGEGGETQLATLSNANGMQVRFIGRGGIILSIVVPDRVGAFADVVLGYRDLSRYINDRFYFGAIVGRNANRIAGAEFELDGHRYELSRNDGCNHLHGGAMGFSACEWRVVPFEGDDEVGANLFLESPAGDQGYPGAVDAVVTYTLNDSNEFIVQSRASVSAATPISLAQHAYFNLSGFVSPDVLAHELTVFASHITPVNEHLIPTGELRDVSGTAFDFRQPKAVGADIGRSDDQLKYGGGYDHNFVLDRANDSEVVTAAKLYDPLSGRMLEVSTTKPGIQIYTGNELDLVTAGKSGAYAKHAGVAIETQHFPDTPNQPAFPPTVVRPGDQYFSETRYRFTTDDKI